MDSFITSGEKTEWPDKAGHYWFYGYRYGKSEGVHDHEKEIIFCEVKKISKGLIVIGNGQIVFRREVEEACFIPATLPELPNE